MTEAFVATLAFASVIAGAVLAFHWQRATLHVETARTSLERVIQASSRFVGDAYEISDLLSVEAKLGYVWDFQRVAMHDAIKRAHAGFLDLVGHIAVHRVASPATAADLSTYLEALRDLHREIQKIRGASPDPQNPDRRNTILATDLTPQALCTQISDRVRTLSESLGHVVNVAIEERLRGLALPKGPLTTLGVSLVVAIAVICYLGAWRAEVRDSEVVWLNLVTGAVEVTQLPAVPGP